MKVRNIINKAAVIGTGALMTGFTVSSALAYDLANYPAQFIVDGAFDGKIVVGANAHTSDVMGAIDIAASLQAGSVTSETVEIPGQAGSVNLQGDAFKIERGSDMLELTETVGKVYSTLDGSDLEALRGGRVSNAQGATNYEQYLRFADGNNAAMQNMTVEYTADDSGTERVLGDYLVIPGTNLPFFEWEMEFTEGLKSRTTGTPATTLRDYEGRTVNIFGTDFTIVQARTINSGAGIQLEFMAGDVDDVLREGETKTYTIDGVDYTVQAVFISDPASGGTQEARFAVNGELTNSLEEGETDTLNTGMEIGVRNILTHGRDGIVEFFLGANKVEFRDSNVSVEDGSGTVRIGTRTISDASVDIIASQDGSGIYSITNIKYSLVADSNQGGTTVYVPAGHGVREFLRNPEGLLSPTFDIRFEGLTEARMTPLTISPVSRHSYDIRATNVRGHEFSFPVLTADAENDFDWGNRNGHGFWFQEPANLTAGAASFPVERNDYFLVSSVAQGSADERTDSAVFRYVNINTGESDRTLSFRNLATGETQTVSFTVVNASASGTPTEVWAEANNFRSHGRTHKVWIAGADSAGNFPLAVDLDSSGSIDGNAVAFTTHGGGVLRFGTQDTASTEISGVVEMSLEFGDDLYDNMGPETVTWNISSDGSVLELGNLTGVALDSDDSNFDFDYGRLVYGALVEYYVPSSSNAIERLTISIPETQLEAQVFVTAGAVDRSASGPGGVTRDVVSPIAVGLAVLDRDAQGMYGNENLIIVGGPCANTVAAQFLGNPENCAEGFTPGRAGIWARESNGNVAILVAGYEAQETLGAAYVLADYDTYLSGVEGSSVEVVATDLSDLRVQAPTVLDAADME